VHLLLIIPVLLCLFPRTLSGQGFSQNGIDISISAEVQSTTIQLITVQGMDFTGVGRNQLELRIDPATSERAGKMMALGDPNSSFRVSFLRNIQFANMEGDGVIDIEYQVAGFELDEQDNSDLIEMESRELSFSNDGEFFFWVGGAVDLNRATPGTYEGEFTLEIEYL
ncbi:MAG: hypothetical protein WDZ33_00545, partial [Balneolaceae bacterium]